MIIFIKLLLAHLLGDFVLQPDSWVKDKEAKKHKSIYLSLHIILHGLLAWLFVGKADFLFLAIALAALHGAIDLAKLAFQGKKHRRGWFIADQILHVITIAGITLWYSKVDLTRYEINPQFWLYATAVLLLTTPSSIIIKNLISIWTPNQNGTGEDLQSAGKYIGILERLFIFCFIATGHFEAIGFLLAAKSIFRFGDLTQAKDRKLTEYVLIGTLLSFGIAIGTGLLVNFSAGRLALESLY